MFSMRVFFWRVFINITWKFLLVVEVDTIESILTITFAFLVFGLKESVKLFTLHLRLIFFSFFRQFFFYQNSV